MSKDVVFTVKLESDLRDDFLAEAEATHRPASQLVREFMREFIERQRVAREHDAWFRAQVAEGLRDLEDPNLQTSPHQEVMDRVEMRLKERIAQRAVKHEG